MYSNRKRKNERSIKKRDSNTEHLILLKINYQLYIFFSLTTSKNLIDFKTIETLQDTSNISRYCQLSRTHIVHIVFPNLMGKLLRQINLGD